MIDINKKKNFACILLAAAFCLGLASCGEAELTAPGAGFDFDDPAAPEFGEVTVHDPSVMRAGDGWYYIVGSHLASAKSADLIRWEQISTDPVPGNPLAPDFREEMAEALEWAETTTFWAGDWIQLADGRYYMYYCNCRGDSPLACIGLAVSDRPDGPYENQGLILKSGMSKEYAPDGTFYDATVHPNAIDPHVFFDQEGKLWMVYGSYSGGIYILEMDDATGYPLPGQGYGKKLLGGNHARIEAPYIQYNSDTGYYYLFLSFGGLDAGGAYNIRVARSQWPDGPYLDAKGQDMINCMGPAGSFFDDRAVEGFGTKLLGNYRFDPVEGEREAVTTGYLSPGHNSSYFDPETGRYFLIFHTRFEGRGEAHQVRVHQMFFSGDGWPVIASRRYGGESVQPFTPAQLAGGYKVLGHGGEITTEVAASRLVTLTKGGKITGAIGKPLSDREESEVESGFPLGTWSLGEDGYTMTAEIDGTTYSGLFLRQYDDDQGAMTMTFTAISAEGQTLWGSGVIL